MVEDDELQKTLKPIKLNFTYIYKVNIDDRNSETLKKVGEDFKKLPEFKDGNRNNIGYGFIDFDDDFDIEFVINTPLAFNNQENSDGMRFENCISMKNILAKRFRYEIYAEGRSEPQYGEADIFWIKPCDILIIKGSQRVCKRIERYLVRFINAGFNQIEFKHDFLLWMCYKYEKFNGKLSNDLDFERMVRSRTHGVAINENDIRVREGQGRMIPIPTLYGLLNEQELSHLGGDFNFQDNYTISAKLDAELGIYVYSDYDLTGKTYSEKCALSFPFIIEIVNIFEKWDNRDTDDDKYPDDEFFDQTIESFKTQMQYSIESIKELKEKYGKLRNGV